MIDIKSINDEIDQGQLSDASLSTVFKKYATTISYHDFFKNNMEKNKPCLFGSWLTQNWLSRQKWVMESGQPNCQLLSNLFGQAEVPVANCNKKCFDAQEKENLIFKDYLDYFGKTQHGKCDDCLYLKDWHFVRAFPEYHAYQVPSYFASDWLNEFWANRSDPSDDYRFVYMGPKGSWTPFHADVFRSFSWSANICGRKRWVFYPPSEESFLKNRFGDLPYDVESPELSDYAPAGCRPQFQNPNPINIVLPNRDPFLFPNFGKATGKVEMIQERGETIFVPSNWFHQVWNLEDTISINHNWINGSNIKLVLEFFLSSLKEVEEAIEDCKGMDDWVKQCQLILKSTHGMDASEFYSFLRTISLRRINYLKGNDTLCSFPEWRFGKNHVMYDIRKLIWCLEHFLQGLPFEIQQNLEDDDEHPALIIDQLNSFI